MAGKNPKRIFLSLGSNLGSRRVNILNAITLMHEEIGVVELQSSHYETQAWGNQIQAPFINMIIMIRSSLTAHQILNMVNSIELKLGRIRNEKWEPRTIDIDIIYYDDEIINTKELIVPHPWMDKRKFVLIPLAEIASDFVHPVLKKNSIQLLNECEDLSEVILIKD